MFARSRFALVALVVAVGSSQGCRRSSDALPFLLEVGKSGPLVFPPGEGAWIDRIPFAGENRAETKKPDDESLHLDYPTLDDAKHFEISGQNVTLRFSEVLVDPKAKAPPLVITPAVHGTTSWAYGSEVSFRATKPFDPDTMYTIALPELTAPSGKKLEGGFKATFKATPIVEIAGKTIHYIPKPGHARVVSVLPSDDDEIGQNKEITIVYDQPVDLGLASRLVTITDDADAPLFASLRHPDVDVFDGARADRRIIVLARVGARPPGSTLKVEARPQQKDEDEPTKRTLKIAKPPQLVEVGCSSECSVDGQLVRGTSSTSLAVRFSNPLGIRWGEASKHVRIAPPARNVYVSSYGSDVDVSASFAASTTYDIRVEGLRDRFGAPIAPVDVKLVTRPLSTSLTIGERVMLLDEASTKAFTVTSRNVTKGEIAFWPIAKGDTRAVADALEKVRSEGKPDGDPVVVPFAPSPSRDVLVDTRVDLSKKLDVDRAYIAEVRSVATVKDAPEPRREDGKPVLALVHTGGPRALAAHVHEAGKKAVVQVFRLASGEPVAAATVSVGSESATTDANGTALVSLPSDVVRVARIVEKDTELLLPFDAASSTDGEALFPDLSAKGADEHPMDAAGALVVDRGVYRPGSKMFVKGITRKIDEKGARPLASTKVRLRVIDPLDADVKDEILTTNERGVITSEVVFDPRGHTGRFRVRLELDDAKHSLLATEEVRVADFEAPRFKVDVERAQDKSAPGKLSARVTARYLFGEPMKGGQVSWILRKRAIPVKAGRFDGRLRFDHESSWWDEDGGRRNDFHPVTGEATLGADGTVVLDVATGPAANVPTEITLEADVADASNRHVAGHLRIENDPVGKHAGLRLSQTFGDAAAPLRVDLGVVDDKGEPIVGARVGARLERLRWTRAAEKAESGAIVERWRYVPETAAECQVTSAAEPAACELRAPTGGSYRVTARAFGRDHASAWFYAWGGYGADTSGVPAVGKKIFLALDKSKYAAGDTAKILVRSPYGAATALLTIEQGALLRHETRRITGPSATFDVPVTDANAPWVHASVTLLPLGAREADYRVGVVRIPVTPGDGRLEVKVASGKKTYDVRDEAEIAIDVSRGGAPLKNADVALAVVDEGVLRMTSFHAKDPSVALRYGQPLAFRASDSRSWIMSRREKAHVAGGGDSAGEDALDTRKNFVETLAFLPNLVTDDQGRIRTKVKLPDNLTEFRMMVVAIDDGTTAGTAESSFVVTKPLLLDPVMPRFAQRGDHFEAAAMVHNTTDAPVPVKVTIAGQARDVTVPAKDRVRVGVPINADKVGTHAVLLSLEAFGSVRDKVEVPLRVEEPGIEEHPQLSGVFGEKQEVALTIPEDATFEDDAFLTIKTGSALYPELGQRLSYLLDYPHGCVEQTTSSTLPLIAAKTLIPWTGTSPLPDAELRKRIEAGITRLASMQTGGGGLAYWPGGSEPNTYGSAYALRAILRAKEMGIVKPGLAEGVTKYLATRLPYETDKNLRVSIAEVLARSGELTPSSADALYDAREELDVFGLASAAIAVASLPKQEDRVKDLLDRLEKSFDADGVPQKGHDARDYHYWGSADRDRAQAVIALVRLRPSSPLVRVISARLSQKLTTYTTQATAWSLLALADFVGDRSPSGSLDVAVKLEGRILDTYKRLGGDNKEVHIPLRELRGRKVTLLLGGDYKTPSAFAIDARYKRPLAAAASRAGKRAPTGVSIHRVYTDPLGKPIDLQALKPGQLVRVAVRVELPEIADYRRSYLAIVDRLPGGFEPVETDLATTAHVPDITSDHPFYNGLTSYYGARANHIDRRDDRVQVYFDRVSYQKTVHASYVVRATTPGEFVLPPCSGELMYENDSEGWSDAGKVVIK